MSHVVYRCAHKQLLAELMIQDPNNSGQKLRIVLDFW